MFDWLSSAFSGNNGGSDAVYQGGNQSWADFAKAQNSVNNSGISDMISSVGDSIGGAMDSSMNFLNNNQKSFDTLGTLAQVGGGLYDAYNTNKALEQQQAYQQGLLGLQSQQMALTEAERQRQISKELEAQSAMQGGFESSGLGLYDDKKKQQVLTDSGRNIENSNYYGV